MTRREKTADDDVLTSESTLGNDADGYNEDDIRKPTTLALQSDQNLLKGSDSDDNEVRDEEGVHRREAQQSQKRRRQARR